MSVTATETTTKKPTITSELDQLFAKKPAKSAIFGSDEDSPTNTESLFKPLEAKREEVPKRQAQTKAKSLFDTDDEDDDDHKAPSFVPTYPKTESTKAPTPAKTAPSKKSLFDSDNEDNDFASALPKTRER